MRNTLIGFKWNNKQDIKWLTDYFSDAKRQPVSGISIPNIKRLRDGKSKEEFERFFVQLLKGNNEDKKLRKNVVSAWRSKLKQLQNHKQVNIELTSDAYEQLIILKDRRGTKSTIKDTILDLIDNEYQIQDDMLMSLEDKIRKEITREMKNEIREKVIKEMANKESKASRQRNTLQIMTPENQLQHDSKQSAEQANIEGILMEKIDALAKDTNAKFEKLELMLTALTKKDDSPIKGEISELGAEVIPEIEESDRPTSPLELKSGEGEGQYCTLNNQDLLGLDKNAARTVITNTLIAKAITRRANRIKK